MFFIFLYLSLYFLKCCDQSGNFEIQLTSFQINHAGMSKIPWCNGMQYMNRERNSNCKMFFSVCLKEHQGSLTKTRGCALGNTTTHIPEKELLPEGTSQTLEGSQILIKLPFTFAWTVSVHIICFSFTHAATCDFQFSSNLSA